MASKHLLRARDYLNLAITPKYFGIDNLKACLDAMLGHLEAQERLSQASSLPPEMQSHAGAGPTSKPSSPPTIGPWLKLEELHYASLNFMRTRIRTAIMESFKSIGFISPVLEETFLDSGTLQLILRWPTASTVTTTAGVPGRASPTEGEEASHE